MPIDKPRNTGARFPMHLGKRCILAGGFYASVVGVPRCLGYHVSEDTVKKQGALGPQALGRVIGFKLVVLFHAAVLTIAGQVTGFQG